MHLHVILGHKQTSAIFLIFLDNCAAPAMYLGYTKQQNSTYPKVNTAHHCIIRHHEGKEHFIS